MTARRQTSWGAVILLYADSWREWIAIERVMRRNARNLRKSYCSDGSDDGWLMLQT
jgi:hypothetical protein